ncbi:hypothetical protein RJ639_034730 [Escallonia herrerae]|uniref:Histidine--tRNA ligase, cytoplasmic n=1 Tax=Escallonia herrerae TaxID=1293975 RepID=A0AA88XC04_9ASTE|nr:hypothetical protein RJ639_034730 [Escallonia herrerae]
MPQAAVASVVATYEMSPSSDTDDGAALEGICTVLDQRLSALSAVADAVAALSCEALKADVTAAFAWVSTVSADGSSSDKDIVAVVSDFKVLLKDSKLTVKQLLHDNPSITFIPPFHGHLRSVARSVRLELKSSSARTWSMKLAAVVSSLELPLLNVGEASLGRAELCLLASSLLECFKSKAAGWPDLDAIQDIVKSSRAAHLRKDYVKAVNDVCDLCDLVRKSLSWEALTAFVSLEGSELLEKSRGTFKAEGSEGNAKPDKKREKKKKITGKGTTDLIQFIKEELQLETTEGVEISTSVEKWAQGFLSLFDPNDPRFESLLDKVKEIVDSNESRRLPKLPKGTRDFAKEQMAVRDKAFKTITDVFKRHGAMALDTPAFELRETLMGKYGEDSKLVYDLADQGGELCSLRYDLTVPFARYVAMNGITSMKRYQIGKVHRRDNPSKGRYREFYQCDFDIAGDYKTVAPDSEVVKILTELLDELNIGDYEIKLNHRKLLDGILNFCGVPTEKFRTICSSIDKLDKLSFEQIKREMVDEKGLDVETANKIGTFVKQRGRPLELLAELQQGGSEFLEEDPAFSALNEMDMLFKCLESAGCIDKVVLDLSLARGLDYYTGVIFEAVFKGATQVGSIAAGGRYDDLIGMFGTKKVPAVGVSLGIERVFTIMEQQLQKDQNQAIRATETQIQVSVLSADLLPLAFKLASACWNARISAEYMVHKQIMKHINRAIELRIPFMVIAGKDEIEKGVVKLKDVVANKEEEVPSSDFFKALKREEVTLSDFAEELIARLRSMSS